MSPRERLAELRQLRLKITRQINDIERLGGAQASSDDDDVQEIVTKAAARFGVTVALVMSNTRMSEVVRARQLAAWMLRQQLGLSYPAIGRILGRDHTTVMHAIRKVDAGRVERGAA